MHGQARAWADATLNETPGHVAARVVDAAMALMEKRDDVVERFRAAALRVPKGSPVIPAMSEALGQNGLSVAGLELEYDFALSQNAFTPGDRSKLALIHKQDFTRLDHLETVCIAHSVHRQIAEQQNILKDAEPDLNIRIHDYQDFRRDQVGYLNDILAYFETGLELNETDLPSREDKVVHYRKADPGEWRERFTPGDVEAMSARLPGALRDRFGWED